MIPAGESDCDECVPAYLRDEEQANDGKNTSAFAAGFFLLLSLLAILAIIASLVLRFFPVLAGDARSRNLRLLFGSAWNRKRAVALTLCITIVLTAFLTELILCEVAKCLSVETRGTAMRGTMSLLLFILVLVTPALEIHSIVSSMVRSGHGNDGSSGSSSARAVEKGKRWVTYFMDTVGMAGWLVAYWSVGYVLSSRQTEYSITNSRTLMEEYLKCTGVIGICLMASLSGFAAVSAVWQTFGHKAKQVTESDIQRKQYGLEATTEMLASKQNRLQALNRKSSQPNSDGANISNSNGSTSSNLFVRTFNSIRGSNSSDLAERRSLELEVAGLERMRDVLSPALYAAQARRAAQLYDATPMGRRVALLKRIFAVYCVHRLVTTGLAVAVRGMRTLVSSRLSVDGASEAGPLGDSFSYGQNGFDANGFDAQQRGRGIFSSSAASTDPINRVLALLARHVDPTLDREAWSRQISFALSGVMLLASVGSAMQTFLLLSRLAPAGLLRQARANLALLVSQVAATYVMASALLLRSNLPRHVGDDISDALGIGLEPRFVERWFERWFLGVGIATALGIWVGKKFKASDLDDDLDGEDVEMYKIS